MLGSERDHWRIADSLLMALFAALGGTLASLLVVRVGWIFFYQMFTPEVLMWACGHSFRHPLPPSSAMVNFLLEHRPAAFDCASISPDAPTGPPGFFVRSQLYFSWIVAWLWRLLGPTQTAVAPLAAALGAGYATACFFVARLFLPRMLSVVAAAALTSSPVAIGMVFMLRDYSKAPFFLWAIALLVLAVRAPALRRACLLAGAAGAVAGIGYGFRADLGILLPIGLVFLAIASPLHGRMRLGPSLVYAAGYLLFAAPILTLSNGGNAGSLIMQGATEPFRAFLGLRPAVYALGSTYSDELTLSAVAAAERPLHPEWDAREPAPYYGFSQAYAYSFSYLMEWAPNFPADFAAQALKGPAWILGYPALVAVTRGAAGTGFPLRIDIGLVRWQEPIYALFAHAWMPFVGLLGVLAWLSRVAARSSREARGLAVLLLLLTTYPGIQFSIRHVFHLEFIWVVATLSLPAAVWEFRRVTPVLPRVVLTAACALAGIALAYAGLAGIQQQRLTASFSALLAAPREDVAFEREPQPDGAVLLRVPVPASQAALVGGSPDSMTPHIAEVGVQNSVRAGAERMILELHGAACSAPTVLGLRYDHRPDVWQPLDGALAARPGDIVVFPAFYRATQNFAGILLSRTDAGCTVRLARVQVSRSLPVVLTAVLPQNWMSLPLRKGLGWYGVGPVQ